MRCSGCYAENPAGMRFCGQCAARLGAVCPSCGSANPPENRFCGSCAAPLDTYRAPGFPEPALLAPSLAAASAHVGEMKQVSILFCDIVGSTALTERSAPRQCATRQPLSRSLDRRGAALRWDRAAIRRRRFHGGFRRPADPRRPCAGALLAALGIQRALSGAGAAADRQRWTTRYALAFTPGPLSLARSAATLAWTPRSATPQI